LRLPPKDGPESGTEPLLQAQCCDWNFVSRNFEARERRRRISKIWLSKQSFADTFIERLCVHFLQHF
jgi:hypothetical protein